MNHSTMKSCPGKDCKTKCCRYTFLFLFFSVPADKKTKKRLLTGVKDSIPKDLKSLKTHLPILNSVPLSITINTGDSAIYIHTVTFFLFLNLVKLS